MPTAPQARAMGSFPLTIPTWNEYQGMQAAWAMQVPAFNRGVRLISGTVAQLPMIEWADGQRTNNTFLAQPEPDMPVWVTLQRTVADMVLYGVGYWQVRLLDGQGFPKYVKWISAERVTMDANGNPAIDGEAVPLADPATAQAQVGSLIVFPGYSPGALVAGYDILQTAVEQENAAKTYAQTPSPTQILKNTSNYELSDSEIDQMLSAYQSARQASSVAYLNGGVDLTTFGYSAHDTQLVEARNQTAIQIARILNLDPFWVGSGVPGSALTYQNRVDMRQDLVDLTLSDYLTPIEQRLSMWDVTPTKFRNQVRFETSAFLRSNLDARATMAVQLVGAGIITTDEARAFLSDAPAADAPLG